jgi:drug/metabolite transporter (DMT)-like permease
MVALVLEAVGVVFLSKGLKQVGEIRQASAAELVRVAKSGVTNRCILLGVLFEAVFFAGLLVLLSRSDVSLIWPLTSLGFVLTTLAARLFLHEQVSWVRWVGVCLIMVGAGMISWTEHQKPKLAPTPAEVHAPASPK